MDTGVQLGRRFRALKLWMVLRHFGAEGLRERLAEHIRLATTVRAVGRAIIPTSQSTAPVPFSVVCFRANGTDELNEQPARSRERERRGVPVAHAPRRTVRAPTGHW